MRTQEYNRYSYVLNNPLKYTDPSGELLSGILRGLADAIFSGGLEFWNWGDQYWRDAWSEADPFLAGTAGNNMVEIGLGYLKGPDFFGQLPQNTAGAVGAHFTNLFGNVNSVQHFDGATIIQGNNDGLLWGLGGPAFASGNFIVADGTIEADPNNPLFQHEFGHVLQSRDMNWGYLSRVGLHSFRSKGSHNFHPVEQDANRRAFIYFNERDPNFQNDASQGLDMDGVNRGWSFVANPLDINKTDSGAYVDYSDPLSRRSLNNMWNIGATDWDRGGWFIPFGPWIVGNNNRIAYNKFQ